MKFLWKMYGTCRQLGMGRRRSVRIAWGVWRKHRNWTIDPDEFRC